MLEVKNIDIKYGRIHVVHNVSLTVKEGEFVSVIGSNGAGKSTILKTISGLLRATNGSINFMGEDICVVSPNGIVSRGISHIPEGRKIFPTLSVLENLELGAFTQKARQTKDQQLDQVFSLFPVLKVRQTQESGTLSGGEQQMLAIGRGLMSMPKLLLLDEPFVGLAPVLVQETIEIIKEINKRGTTILLVEQNVRYALMYSDRAYVLENGSMVLEGRGDELLSNTEVKKAYLGL